MERLLPRPHTKADNKANKYVIFKAHNNIAVLQTYTVCSKKVTPK